MKSIKKEYTAPKAEIIEFECEDVITSSGPLKDKGYTRVGTKSWFEDVYKRQAYSLLNPIKLRMPHKRCPGVRLREISFVVKRETAQTHS